MAADMMLAALQAQITSYEQALAALASSDLPDAAVQVARLSASLEELRSRLRELQAQAQEAGPAGVTPPASPAALPGPGDASAAASLAAGQIQAAIAGAQALGTPAPPAGGVQDVRLVPPVPQPILAGPPTPAAVSPADERPAPPPLRPILAEPPAPMPAPSAPTAPAYVPPPEVLATQAAMSRASASAYAHVYSAGAGAPGASAPATNPPPTSPPGPAPSAPTAAGTPAGPATVVISAPLPLPVRGDRSSATPATAPGGGGPGRAASPGSYFPPPTVGVLQAQTVLARMSSAFLGSFGTTARSGGPGSRGPAGAAGRGQQGQGGLLVTITPTPLPVTLQGSAGGRGGGGGGGGGAPAGTPEGELTARITATRRLAEAERTRARYMASPEGQRALKAEAAAQKELASAQSMTSYARISAEQGMFVAGTMRVEEVLGRAREAMAGVTSAAQTVWQTGTSAFFALSAAASPNAMETFRGSLEMLAISVGTSLVPWLDAMSLAVQKAARMYDALSAETKSWVGIGIISATAFAGIAVAIAKVVAVTRTMLAVMQSSYLLMANPWGLGITAALVAVGALAALWLSVRDNASEAADSMDRAGSTQIRGRPGEKDETKGLTSADLRNVPEEYRSKLLAARADQKKLAEVAEAYRATQAKVFEEARLQDLGMAFGASEGDIKAGQILAQMVQQYQRLAAMARAGKPMPPEEKDFFGYHERAYKAYQAGRDQEARQAMLSSATLQVGSMMSGMHIPEEIIKKVTLDMAESLNTPRFFARRPEQVGSGFIDYWVREAGDKRLQQAREALAQAQMVAQKAMITPGVQPQAEGIEGLLRSGKGLPQVHIRESTSYAEALQASALKADDLEAANQTRQLLNLLAEAGKTNELLRDIKENTGRNENLAPEPWRGPRRGPR